MSKRRLSSESNFWLRVIVSAIASIGVVLTVFFPHAITAVTAALIVVALLPWLSPLIKSIEITGVGKLELAVQGVEKNQALILKFLVEGYVTNKELIHLRTLASDSPFPYVRGAGRDDVFVSELIRLWTLGLIDRRESFWNLPLEGNLREHAWVTALGKSYLELRDQLKPTQAIV